MLLIIFLYSQIVIMAHTTIQNVKTECPTSTHSTSFTKLSYERNNMQPHELEKVTHGSAIQYKKYILLPPPPPA